MLSLVLCPPSPAVPLTILPWKHRRRTPGFSAAPRCIHRRTAASEQAVHTGENVRKSLISKLAQKTEMAATVAQAACGTQLQAGWPGACSGHILGWRLLRVVALLLLLSSCKLTALLLLYSGELTALLLFRYIHSIVGIKQASLAARFKHSPHTTTGNTQQEPARGKHSVTAVLCMLCSADTHVLLLCIQQMLSHLGRVVEKRYNLVGNCAEAKRFDDFAYGLHRLVNRPAAHTKNRVKNVHTKNRVSEKCSAAACHPSALMNRERVDKLLRASCAC